MKSIKLVTVLLVMLMISSFGYKPTGNEKVVISFVKTYNSHNKDSVKHFLSEDFKYIATSGHELSAEALVLLSNYEKIVKSQAIVKKIESSGDSVKTVQEYPDMLDSLIGKPTFSDQRVYVVRNQKIKSIKILPLDNSQALMDSTHTSWIRFYQWAEKEYPQETALLKNEVENQGATMLYLANEYYKARKQEIISKARD